MEVIPSLALPKPTLEEVEAEFLPSFQAAFKTAPYLGEIYDWAAKEVELPAGYNPCGKFNVNVSPYLTDVFKAIRDPKIRQVNLMAPPRSGKTLLAEIVLLYLIVNAPGNILWVQATEASMKKMGDSRMSKLLKLCPSVEKLIDKNDRYAITQKKYKFANGVEVHLASATLKALQSFGYKYIVFDEVWMADPGLIAEVQARIGDFPNTYKIILISQGGSLEQNPDWELEFNRAPIKEYGYVCPACKTEQVYTFNKQIKGNEFGGLYWPRNATTFVDGQWVIAEAAKAAVLKCTKEGCGHCIKPEEREYLDGHSLYLTTKAEGDTEKASFRFNSLAVPKVSFQTLAKEWLEADLVSKSTGDTTLKEKFFQKRMAETWGTQKITANINLKVLVVPDGEEWQANSIRFLTVDVQRRAPNYWWVVREWAPNGDSRKIAHGSAHNWEEIGRIREQHKVKISRVLVDSGDGPNADVIYEACTMADGKGYWGKAGGVDTWFCYTACKGSGQWNFKENANKPFKLDKQSVVLTDPKYRGVPGCPYVVWSNFRIKSILEHLRDGKGAKWLSNDNDPEYQKQIVSEVVVRDNGKPVYKKLVESAANEYWDCETLQVLAAVMSGRLSLGSSSTD